MVACPANAGSDHSRRRAGGVDWMIWREDPHAVRRGTGHSAAVQACGILKEAVELMWADYWTRYARLTLLDDRISRLYGDGGS